MEWFEEIDTENLDLEGFHFYSKKDLEAKYDLKRKVASVGRTFHGKYCVQGFGTTDPNYSKRLRCIYRCSECAKDTEMFGEGLFMCLHSNFVKGEVSCGCSGRQYRKNTRQNILTFNRLIQSKQEVIPEYKSLVCIDILYPDKGNIKGVIVCSECNSDIEMFPEPFLVPLADFTKGKIPCACRKGSFNYSEGQWVIRANREIDRIKTFNKYYSNLLCVEAEKGKGECILKIRCEVCHGTFPTLFKEPFKIRFGQLMKAKGSPCACNGTFRWSEEQFIERCRLTVEGKGGEFLGLSTVFENNRSKVKFSCELNHLNEVQIRHLVNPSSIGWCSTCKTLYTNGTGYYSNRTEEQDFLYVLSFDDEYLKVGRSFDINTRKKQLKCKARSKILREIRILTGTHQEVYDTEQFIHNELRKLGFDIRGSWSEELFKNESLDLINAYLNVSDLEDC